MTAPEALATPPTLFLPGAGGSAGFWRPVADRLSARLGAIRAPTLLLWRDRDPISPVAVGERLQALLPDARLQVVAGADHDLAQSHAAVAADLIGQHLAAWRPAGKPLHEDFMAPATRCR